jgi:DNA-binding YbaB/EbfC family protein
MDFNINKIMEQAKAMQAKMAEQESQKANKDIEGKAGTGDELVTVTLDCRHIAKKIQLPKKIDFDDKEFLGDLILAAFNDASNKVTAENKNGMEGLGAGMDLGAFGNLLKQ